MPENRNTKQLSEPQNSSSLSSQKTTNTCSNSLTHSSIDRNFQLLCCALLTRSQRSRTNPKVSESRDGTEIDRSRGGMGPKQTETDALSLVFAFTNEMSYLSSFHTILELQMLALFLPYYLCSLTTIFAVQNVREQTTRRATMPESHSCQHPVTATHACFFLSSRRPRKISVVRDGLGQNNADEQTDEG